MGTIGQLFSNLKQPNTHLQLSPSIPLLPLITIAKFNNIHYSILLFHFTIKLNGQGKFYFEDGTLRYDGELKNYNQHGYGVEYGMPNNGDVYTGNFYESDWTGQGTLTLANGNIHSGEWEEEKLNGVNR